MSTTKSSIELYYIEPSDAIFTHLRTTIIDHVWKKYNDTYGYASGKIDYINSLDNLSDNFMTMWGMLDVFNQQRVLNKINFRTYKAIKDRGGILEWLDVPSHLLKKELRK